MIRVHETWNDGTEPASFTLDNWEQFDRYVTTLATVPYWSTSRRTFFGYRKMLPNRVEFRTVYEGENPLIHLSAELVQHHATTDCAFCRLHAA